MEYSNSSFIAPNNTRLDQYQGELNATWVREFTANWPNLCRIHYDKVHRTSENLELGSPNTNGSEHFVTLNQTIPSSYVVECKFWNQGYFSEYFEEFSVPPYPPDTVHPCGIVTHSSQGYLRANSFARIGGRGSSGLFNGYGVFYDQLNCIWKLQKYTNHVVVKELSYFDPIPVNNFSFVQLVVRGYFIELWVNHKIFLFFRDEGAEAYASAGKIMLRFDSEQDNFSNDEFSTKGIHLSNFRISDEFPPLPIPEEIILYGNGDSFGQVSLSWTE